MKVSPTPVSRLFPVLHSESATISSYRRHLNRFLISNRLQVTLLLAYNALSAVNAVICSNHQTRLSSSENVRLKRLSAALVSSCGPAVRVKLRRLDSHNGLALAHPRFKNWGGSVCMESVHKRGAGACRGAKRRAREGSGEGRPPPPGWGSGSVTPGKFWNLRCNLVQSGAFWQEIDGSLVFHFCERKYCRNARQWY